MTKDLSQHPQGRKFELNHTNDPINKHISSGSPDITWDATLSYLNQILLEEDINEKDILHNKESALYAMEKPLYDILGEIYPPVDNRQLKNHTESGSSSTDHHLLNQHSFNFGILSASEYNKGLEEGNRFLPRMDKPVLGMEAKKLSSPLVPEEVDLVKLNSDKNGQKNIQDFMGCMSMGKKRSDVDLDILEERNCKISMSHFDEPPRNDMFDEVLLYNGNFTQSASLQEHIQNNTSKYCENDQVRVADIKALLIECSDAVYANDRQLAESLIKKVQKLSSLDGDATQRMAAVIADALEARLNGIGSEAWRRVVGRRITSFECLKIAQLYMTVSPFPRTSLYYSNKTILEVAGESPKLHIVDFGIGFGFQWPSLIQALSNKNSCKSIKLKITGIDFPLPGFRPAELLQETGRRLEAYAERFGVSFEYQGIASKWENVSLVDLGVKEDEVIIINSLYRFREVGDEAVSLDSPRNRVLDLIRQIRPHLFIHGVLSVRAFSPFFLSRFRQALSIYPDLFEILDILIPGDNKERKLIERVYLAHDILNVLACEGLDWIVKPETYKQWHLRNLRAGLEQIPLNPVLLEDCKDKMKKGFNNSIFFIEEDKNWLLQGWSGRVFFAISTWKAKLA